MQNHVPKRESLRYYWSTVGTGLEDREMEVVHG